MTKIIIQALGSKLRNFILFNIIFSVCIISIFYFDLELSYKIIGIHFVFIIYYLVAVLLLLIIFNRFKIFKHLTSIILITYQFFILLVYLCFYFGMKEVGVPYTIEIIYPYVSNLNLLIKHDFISSYKLIIYIMFLVLIFILLLKSYRNTNNNFIKLNKIIFKNKPISNMVFAIVFISLPSIIFSLNSLPKKLRELKNFEPSLTIFYATINHEERDAGLDNLKVYEKYERIDTIEKRNVILIICDALRADYLGVYGNKNNISPFIDSLVSTKTFSKYNHIYSTTSWSYSGISNIFSSSYKLFNNNFFIHDALKKQGYDINFILSGDFKNYYQLKNHLSIQDNNIYYDGLIANQKNSNINLNDDENIVIEKLKRIEDSNGNPTFFYLHYMSTHQVGTLNPVYEKFTPNTINLANESHDKIALRNDYKNRIIQLDNYLKKTFNILKEKKYLDNALVIITSDHGQSLGENNKFHHAKSTYLSEIRIPLIISDNSDNVFTKNFDVLGNQLDIGPTLFDQLGLPIPQNWKGESLVKKNNSKPIFQHQRFYYSTIWKEADGYYHYVFNKKTLKEEIFKIDNDSLESRNLIKKFKDSSRFDSIKNLLFQFYEINK